MYILRSKKKSPISSFHIIGLKTDPLHTPALYPESSGYLEPSTIAIMVIDQVKFFFQEPGSATKERLDSLWGEVMLLEKAQASKYDIGVICSLYITAAFFQDERMQRKASRRLFSQLKKMRPIDDSNLQELLLDCVNIGERMGVNGQQIRDYLKNTPLSQGPIQDYANRLYIK